MVEDILYTEDFSKANQDELSVMPSKYFTVTLFCCITIFFFFVKNLAKYCKRLYLDVTSSNYGKITWETIKPIIHGKILFAPDTDDTNSIMKHVSASEIFYQLNR